MAKKLDTKAIRHEAFMQLCAERRRGQRNAIAKRVIEFFQELAVPDELIADVLELLDKARVIPNVAASEEYWLRLDAMRQIGVPIPAETEDQEK